VVATVGRKGGEKGGEEATGEERQIKVERTRLEEVFSGNVIFQGEVWEVTRNTKRKMCGLDVPRD